MKQTTKEDIITGILAGTILIGFLNIAILNVIFWHWILL